LEAGPEPKPSDARSKGSTDIESEKLRFERQKFALEMRFKRRELDKDKGKGGFKEALGNPLVLAIVGGILTLMTTTVSNYLTGRENRDSETLKARLAQQSARETLQADLIKKFVESSKIEVVRQNLRFLVDSGLIPTYADSIRSYLKANPDAAPRVGGGVEFSPGGESVDDTIKQSIQDAVTRYQSFLQNIGFSRLDQRVSVYIYSVEKPSPIGETHVNAYYKNGTIFMHKSMAGYLTVALHEYTHYALYRMLGSDIRLQDQIEAALADYLPASFLDSPVIGAGLGKIFGFSTDYIRRLDADVQYDRTATSPVTKSLAWGAALWTCRQKVGRGPIDGIILQAWTGAEDPPATDDVIAERFGKALSTAASPVGSCFAQEIAHRHLP